MTVNGGLRAFAGRELQGRGGHEFREECAELVGELGDVPLDDDRVVVAEVGGHAGVGGVVAQCHAGQAGERVEPASADQADVGTIDQGDRERIAVGVTARLVLVAVEEVITAVAEVGVAVMPHGEGGFDGGAIDERIFQDREWFVRKGVAEGMDRLFGDPVAVRERRVAGAPGVDQADAPRVRRARRPVTCRAAACMVSRKF